MWTITEVIWKSVVIVVVAFTASKHSKEVVPTSRNLDQRESRVSSLTREDGRIDTRVNLIRVRLETSPVGQRVDTECGVPDEEPRNESTPDQSSQSVTPERSNQSRRSETKEERSNDIVSMLEANDWGLK